MDIQIINHQGENNSIEAHSGIIIRDGEGHEFRIKINKFGELVVNGTDGKIFINPQYSNEIILVQKE